MAGGAAGRLGGRTVAARIRRASLPVRVAAALIFAVALFFVLLAAFPWGLVAGHAAGPLSRLLGRSVRIGGADRIDGISLSPTVELRDVTVGQPAGFAGGPMARVASVRVRFAALPLLIGRFRPAAITMSGGRLLLVRDGAGHANWESGDKGDGTAGASPSLSLLTVRDTALRLDDAKRHIRLDAAVTIDPRSGLAIGGSGTHRGTPIRLAIRAADPSSAGPVHISVRSALAGLDGIVTPDRPLDLARFRARFATDGTDLTYLDDIVQAGLFPTRPFRLAGTLRRDGADWRVDRLAGTIGHSIVSTRLTIDRRGGRTILNGDVRAKQLDFDDFSSAGQRAGAAARQARTGPRVIPATSIVLDKLARLDGKVSLRADRLLSATPSAFRTLTATATLDRQRLILSPLAAGLRSGTLTGRVVVEDRIDIPRLSLDLRISGARIERLLLPGDAIEGPLSARLRLAGQGNTVREAMSRASGKVGLVVPSGSIRRDYAIYAGGDLLKSVGQIVGGDKGRRVGLRCLVADFAVAGGRMTPRPLVLDAEITRADGTGAILLADETIDLSLRGRAKDPGPIQSTAPVRLVGTLSEPKLDIRPPRAERKGEGGVFDRIGFLLKSLKIGDKARRTAAPQRADCAGLQAAASR